MDRKNALRLLAGTSLGAMLPTRLWGRGRQQRPNILFIMTDDHDEDAISAYGGNLVETPNIDRLATEGMRFDHCYVTNSLCAPSRASILTGKYSHKNGIKKNYHNFDGSQLTVQRQLQQNGYYTAMVGKWHLGSTPTNFDYWIHLPGQGRYFDPRFYEKGTDGLQTIEGYSTDVITDLTIDAIDQVRNTDQPFFLMSHYKAVHAPFSPAPRYRQSYDGRKAPLPESLYDDYEGKSKTAREYGRRWGSSNENRREQYQEFMNPYLETVMGIDENVGRLLDYLDENGLAENTVVIYTTDNGFYLGDHGYLDKRIMYEDALQIPLIVRYPPEIPAGSVNGDMVLNLDFPETFLDYADANIPEAMQGRSLRPLLRGEQVRDWRNSLYYHFYESDGPGNVEKHYGVRTERYKLIYFYTLTADEQPWEMYDLQKDPYEMNNIYDDPSYAETRHFLKEELKRLREYYGDDTGIGVDEHATDLEEERERPGEVQLAQNYPNPFNPSTRIQFTLPTSQRVELKVYNSMGGEVRTLMDEIRPAGRHTVRFDGNSLANGVYFYQLETERGPTLTRKMILLK